MAPKKTKVSEAISWTAPAKLNLFLHIVGRRADGYHLLESLFAFTEKGDEITVRPARGLSIDVAGPFAEMLRADCENDDNLVLKAARALQSHGEAAKGAHIHLQKNLPIAAGIGGGSADAAATLLALNELWRLGLSIESLAEVGLTLGADVPACLYRAPLRVAGIGELVEKTVLASSYGVLLANPRAAVATPAVFEAFHCLGGGYTGSIEKWEISEGSIQLEWIASKTSNDLESAACQLCPVVSDVLQELSKLRNARFVRMSGSGATCFALFDTEAEALAAQRKLRVIRPDWWFFADRLLVG